jgi:hypothetical protein
MKVTFPCQPELVPDVVDNLQQIAADFVAYLALIAYWIPRGYVYDGASIPRIFWFLIGSPFEPVFAAAALVHDWFYLTHLVPRAVADECLYQLLRACGVGTVRAHIIWAAVRSCAGFAWTNNVKDTIELKRIIQELRGRPDRDKFHFAEISVK